jgi:hypothetical protein
MSLETTAKRTLAPLRRHFTSRVYILSIACALTTPAFSQDNSPSVQSSYRLLLNELMQSGKGRPDGNTNARIASAAQSFQSAIDRDGGARANLTKDARNIVASLRDGTFSAIGSVPARIVWTRVCNSGGLFHGGCLTGFRFCRTKAAEVVFEADKYALAAR